MSEVRHLELYAAAQALLDLLFMSCSLLYLTFLVGATFFLIVNHIVPEYHSNVFFKIVFPIVLVGSDSWGGRKESFDYLFCFARELS